jgi:hypothetical protein
MAANVPVDGGDRCIRRRCCKNIGLFNPFACCILDGVPGEGQ